MADLTRKIWESMSDFWLDIELFFGKLGSRNEKIAPLTDSIITEKTKARTSDSLPMSLKLLHFSNKERLFFYNQMETLVGSDVSLIDSLTIVQSQSKKNGLKKLYSEMIHHINGGMSLADTMYLFPKIFPHMQSALIAAGENSGNLKNVFAQITEDLENQQDFMRKIKGAMFYPVLLIILAFTMVTGMMIFVIPKVAKLYQQSNTRLPVFTQKVIDISDYVSAKYPMLLGIIFGSIIFIWIFVTKTKIGRLFWENLVSVLPIFGNISKERNLMVFASNLGMLLQSGVLIDKAFEITENTMDNIHYKKALSDIRHGILLGKNVSELMGLEDIKAQKFVKNKLFPLQVAQLIHIGELTGNIAKMLIKIRQNYHKSIDYTLKNISSMIEPIMIFLVAILVGSILLAVMLPFFYIGNTIS
jgi:type II secretory pathway component PulF